MVSVDVQPEHLDDFLSCQCSMMCHSWIHLVIFVQKVHYPEVVQKLVEDEMNRKVDHQEVDVNHEVPVVENNLVNKCGIWLTCNFCRIRCTRTSIGIHRIVR